MFACRCPIQSHISGNKAQQIAVIRWQLKSPFVSIKYRLLEFTFVFCWFTQMLCIIIFNVDFICQKTHCNNQCEFVYTVHGRKACRLNLIVNKHKLCYFNILSQNLGPCHLPISCRASPLQPAAVEVSQWCVQASQTNASACWKQLVNN